MATIYKKTYARPIPEGATILTYRGRRCARWADRRGRTRTVPVTGDGARLCLEIGQRYTIWIGQTPVLEDSFREAVHAPL